MKKRDTQVMILVDTLERPSGRPVRVSLGLACRPTELGELPVAGSFRLGTGETLSYRGHDGGAYVRASTDPGMLGKRSVDARDHLHLVEALPFPGPLHQITGRRFDRNMMAGYARVGDPGLAERFDTAPLEAAHAKAQRAFARNVVVSAGETLLRTPFPIWTVSADGSEITLGIYLRGAHILGGMTEFEAGRLAAARRFAEMLPPVEGARETAVAGEVLFLDPAFQSRRDRAVVAAKAGAFFSHQFRHHVPDMPPEIVRSWHEAAYAGVAEAAGEAWDAESALQSVSDLIAYGEDPKNACGGRFSASYWDAHRRRVLDIEIADVLANSTVDGIRSHGTAGAPGRIPMMAG